MSVATLAIETLGDELAALHQENARLREIVAELESDLDATRELFHESLHQSSRYLTERDQRDRQLDRLRDECRRLRAALVLSSERAA